MPIRKLPPLLVNQIAAGEVIERPASVVKELVENCLDAGATRVDLVVEEGGLKLIRVADDGRGIPPEELPLALTAHATSKLQTAEQLAAIPTLGFRGEALASIASVSRLRLSSRPRGGDEGAAIEQAGADLTPPRPAAMAPGTVIEVRDLFFNTPARRKFMRTAATEYGHIADTIQRVAMVHPAVGFTLTHNGRKTLDLAPGAPPRRRCVEILGKDLEPALLEFELEEPTPPGPGLQPARVWGLAGEPSIARGSTKFQYLCVNGRPVKDRNLAHAVKEAFRGLIAPDKHPVAAVFVDVDPSLVDVNVHPAKSEVRFGNPRGVHGLVLAPLRERLLEADLVPAAAPPPRGAAWNSRPSVSPLTRPATATPGATPAVDYTQQRPPQEPGFVYEEVRREMDGSELFTATPTATDAPPAPAVAPTPVLQFHHSYVVTPDTTPGCEPGLLIIDQHALHERVMFAELRQRILVDGGDLESQRLLVPAVVQADAGRQALLDDLAPLLARLGIEAAPLGPSAVGVQAFPSLLFDRGVDPTAFLEELLGKAESGALLPDPARPASDLVAEATLHEVLDMMSCKAAVKAGDKLSDAELAALLAQRDAIERSSSCPHGRPTTVRLGLKDLEKQFHRA